MKEFTFYQELWLPLSREEVFAFFGDPRNLETITPPWLSFEVITPGRVEMKAGTRIDYTMRVHGLTLRWQSQITVWDSPYRFVDEQCRGPYRKWIHEHRFEERDGGTLCLDEVSYRPPGGALMNWLFVRRDLKNIFDFRSRRLAQMFCNNRA